MVNKLTFFKNPPNCTYIDLIITNKSWMFRIAKSYETGSSDFYKLVVSIIKLSYNRIPFMAKYKGHKKFSNEHFKNYDCVKSVQIWNFS